MDREFVVRPLPPFESSRRYDLLLACCGYEERSRYFAEAVRPEATRRLAWGFSSRQDFHYSENQEIYCRLGFDYVEPPDSSGRDLIDTLLRETVATEEGRAHICVDISSMTRTRIAIVAASALELSFEGTVSIDFVYCFAAFAPPQIELEPMLPASPVLPEFAGWSVHQDLPSVLVMGLGYEPDKAVGAYEYLEANGAWLFFPSGEDGRYDIAVSRANAELLRKVPERNTIRYLVNRPYETFMALESVASGLRRTARPVLLPFGPKIFALSAILTACLHRDIPVWRISAGEHANAMDRRATGSIVGLSVTLGSARR